MNRIHINIVGEGHPIILLHGWGWSGDIWQGIIPDLADNYQLFLVDLPGFGKSALFSDDYEFGQIIPALLKLLPLNAIWIGWSMGGLFAYWVAIHHPERVSRLITVASSPCFIQLNNWPGIPVQTLDKFENLLSSNHQQTLQDFLELQLRGSANQESMFSSLKQQLLNTNPPSMFGLMGGLKLLHDTDLRNSLHQISRSSLHIFGQRDTIVPVSVAHSLKNLLSNSHIEIIQRTGHMPFLTHQDDFVSLIKKFIS